MATKLESWSYRQFKNALDEQYNIALANLAIDGLASANWIRNDFLQESYLRVWETVSLYSGKKQDRILRGVSGVVDSAWKSNVANYINSHNYGRVKEIHSYSKRLYTQAVNDAVQTATNEGLGIEATQRRIRQLVNGKLKGDINIWRARRIAQTEVISAENYGTWQAQVNAVNDGIDLVKVWRTFMDGNERPGHADANGQIREITQPFEVEGEKLMYPGDPMGSAANVINCRCNQTAVTRAQA